MWEVMILHSLARAGRVQHEQPTADGKNPDIVFASADLVFTADVSCVSDQGIRKRNPFDKLLNEIEHQKRALGLGIGGVYIDVGHSEDHLRVTLKLPPEEDIPGFVAEQVIPKIAQKLGEKEWPIKLAWETEAVQFALTIKDGPYSGGGSRAYDTPKATKANPIYSRLRAKSEQVRKGSGLRGIFLCDGGYSAFSRSPLGWSGVSAPKIAQSFLAESEDVDFVVLVWVEENSSGWDRRITRSARHTTIQKIPNSALSSVIADAIARLPQPKRTGTNARNHLEWKGQHMGFGGGFTIEWPRVKLSATMLMNLLSGRISIEEFNDRHDWTSGSVQSRGRFPNAFERALREGRLPKAIAVESSPDDDDDWLVIDFGLSDAAVSPFTGNNGGEN